MQPHEPAVEIKFQPPPGFAYNAGQFVRIAIPAISAIEYHPITISSAPHEEYVTLHIRRLGDWTDELVQLAENQSETTILIEGPYGASSVGLEDDTKYKLVLCVSGGIGVTPCNSIGKDILHSHKTQGRNLKQLRFVWAVRDLTMVQDIPPLLLKQERNEDYSTSSTQYRRMVGRNESSQRGETSRTSIASDSLHDPSSSTTKSTSTPSPRRPAVVQVDIYSTRHSLDAEQNGQLPFNIYNGRPDLDQIFETFKEEAIALGETNVAVIGCGPSQLMSDLQEACRKHSSSIVGCGKESVFFDLHKEHFLL